MLNRLGPVTRCILSDPVADARRITAASILRPAANADTDGVKRFGYRCGTTEATLRSSMAARLQQGLRRSEQLYRR